MSNVLYCCVLSCSNSSNSGKIFVPVPSNEGRRRRWIEEIGRPTTVVERDLFCCGDHFYFPEDCENYELWLAEGGDVRLKETVIPRFNFTTDLVDFHEYLSSGCALEEIQLKNGVFPHINLIHRLYPCGHEKRWAELRNGVQNVPSENKKKLNFEVELSKIPEKILTEQDWERYLRNARSKAVSKSWFERHKTRLIKEANSENYGGYEGIKIVQSKHGGDLLVYLGYTFCQSHVQKCGRMRWRCSGRTRKFCMSQLITEADKVTPISGTMKLTHNHPPRFSGQKYFSETSFLQIAIDILGAKEEKILKSAEQSFKIERNTQNSRLLFLLSLKSDLREMNDVQFKTFKKEITKIIAEVG